MRPYAPFNSSHTSSDFRFILILSSSGGSMPKIHESWPLPRRNAVRMSNERTVHRWLATHCKANILLSRPSVGESLGSESIRGSSYPKITNRALAFLEVPVSACSISSKDFHVSTHLDLKSWPSGTWLRKIFRTVSVANHESVSFSLAFAKSRASSGERSLIFTSTFCLWLLMPVEFLVDRMSSTRIFGCLQLSSRFRLGTLVVQHEWTCEVLQVWYDNYVLEEFQSELYLSMVLAGANDFVGYFSKLLFFQTDYRRHVYQEWYACCQVHGRELGMWRLHEERKYSTLVACGVEWVGYQILPSGLHALQGQRALPRCPQERAFQSRLAGCHHGGVLVGSSAQHQVALQNQGDYQ